MRLLLFVFLFIVSSCQTSLWRDPSSKFKKIDIVFDLDWTIISLVNESYRGRKNVIAVGDELYRVHDWARELVTTLNNDPRYRVSFFSGGPEQRNLAVLDKIKLLDGSKRSFSDVAHKLLHRNDLLDVEPPSSIANPSPADRWKKDLRKVNPDLEQVIMFEDDARHALNLRQRKNILWMGMSFHHYDTSKELSDIHRLRPDYKFDPPSTAEWSLQRNKLALSYGILQDSVKKLDEDGGRLTEHIQKRLSDSELSENILNTHGKKYFSIGSSELRRLSPKTRRVPLDLKCFDLMGPFFKRLSL